MEGTLYDAETGESLGPATSAQIEASTAACEGCGIILISADGDVVRDYTWHSRQPGVREVYTSCQYHGSMKPTD